MIIADISQGNAYPTNYKLYQYDYGRILRIQGVNLPAAVEIDFGLSEKGGDSIKRIGTTVDGVTDVPIPDSMLENNDATENYYLYAFIYLDDGTSGQTVRKITLKVTARPKPGGIEDDPEREETTFNQIMSAVNKIADGKADMLDYKGNILRLLSGEKELSSVTIAGGSADPAREIELQKSETAIQWRYVGEEDWKDLVDLADLKGDPGPQGPQGEVGPQGPQGIQGQNGADGAPGADGYSPTTSVEQSTDGAKITITDKSGTTEAVVKNGKDGANGRDGADGQPGHDGTDGITPTIGANGNWFLGVTDTGKPSRGATGDTGPTGATGAQGPAGTDGKSAYQYAVEGGYPGTETEFAAKMAQEMPTTLPNPNALIFTGAVTGSYDGSEPMKVNIPSGGSGSGAEKTWSLLLDETLSEDTAYIFQNLSAPVTELIIEFQAGGDGTHRDVTIFNRDGVGYGRNIATFKNVLRSDTKVSASFVIHCVAFPELAFFRCQYNNYNSSVGENTISTSSSLLFGDENGAFKGSTNFDCISIGCWSRGNSGVFKAGTMVKVYGKI